jgi:hypothetical protein
MVGKGKTIDYCNFYLLKHCYVINYSNLFDLLTQIAQVGVNLLSSVETPSL